QAREVDLGLAVFAGADLDQRPAGLYPLGQRLLVPRVVTGLAALDVPELQFLARQRCPGTRQCQGVPVPPPVPRPVEIALDADVRVLRLAEHLQAEGVDADVLVPPADGVVGAKVARAGDAAVFEGMDPRLVDLRAAAGDARQGLPGLSLVVGPAVA